MGINISESMQFLITYIIQKIEESINSNQIEQDKKSIVLENNKPSIKSKDKCC